ncbi:MAG: aconitate hydratase [Clostridiales bacterium]|nr:aconitate hydratase [Clostridiales bacterium]
MGYTMAEKIIKNHLRYGELKRGSEIGIEIDQTLTQDSTGTMVYLQLEALNIDKVKTKLSVAYVDHNMLQQGFENADDHLFIKTAANRFGVVYSKPGNGICHQVHLERFAKPGETLIGSDSHTPTAGGMGMLAMGAGGFDVSSAMAGGLYYITMPKIVNIKLTGKLNKYTSSKDIILELLRRLTVKGGVGKIFEYTGDGVKTLSVPERATITNMGAELGLTTSLFPSDDVTLEFLKKQNREDDYTPLFPDDDAIYDETIEIDLSELEPLIALPHSPDNVVKVSDVAGLKVDQVVIGSCTNSSYSDLKLVANILKDKKANDDVSLVISPGSRQVLMSLSNNGYLTDIIKSGARILECGCGPCIGMGQAPQTGGVSIRTFNRNFKGRCGTQDSYVYLTSPLVAALAAIYGKIVDPREVEFDIDISTYDDFILDDSMFIYPSNEKKEIVKGPNIKPFPIGKELENTINGNVLLKVEDNITTDHIVPSTAKLLPFRSNIPELSNYCFNAIDKDFASRCKSYKNGIIVGGQNYGQGSSREHAALVPLYLGIRAVLVKSFARIHRANLINAGIIPLTFEDEKDYENIGLYDELIFDDIVEAIKDKDYIDINNKTKSTIIRAKIELSNREREIILYGGLLNYAKGAKR